MLANEGIPLSGFQVRRNHLFDKLVEVGAWGPAEFALSLGRITKKGLHLSGAEVAWIDGNDDVAVRVIGFFVEAGPLPGKTQLQPSSTMLDELAHAVLLASSNDIVLRFLLLEHQPLHLDVIAGVAPIALGVEVAHVERLLQADLNPR